MKITYVKDTCNRYGICVEEAPEVFSFAEDGSLVIDNAEPPPELHEKVRDACMLCPTQSIQIEE
jgi:ferredoxin